MAGILLNDLINQAVLAGADIINKYVIVKTGVADSYLDANGGEFAYHIVQEGTDPNFEYAIYPQRKNVAGTGYENDGTGAVVLTLNTKDEVAYVCERANFNFYDGVLHVHEPVNANVGPERTVLMALRDYLTNHFAFAQYQIFIDSEPNVQ